MLFFLLSSTSNYVVSLPIGTWDSLHYFILALPVPSIKLFCLEGFIFHLVPRIGSATASESLAQEQCG